MKLAADFFFFFPWLVLHIRMMLAGIYLDLDVWLTTEYSNFYMNDFGWSLVWYLSERLWKVHSTTIGWHSVVSAGSAVVCMR